MATKKKGSIVERWKSEQSAIRWVPASKPAKKSQSTKKKK